jgi:hypothetical protein
MKKSALGLLCVVGAALAGAGGSSAEQGFTAHVDNPWFPLQAGARYEYTGVKDGAPSRDIVLVSRRTATIAGRPCAVVDDRLYLRGRLRERTTDWYSQDARGNVWYMGESTAELDTHGRVTSTEGTWQAGVDGAVAGIYMPASPRVGMAGRQEYYRGHAEDRFRVIGVFRTVVQGKSARVVLTQETTRLEPGTVDHKLYVHGIGTVLEQTERGGDERNELVSLTTSS